VLPSLELDRSSVTGNTATDWGGGIVVSGADTEITQSTVSGNSAGNYGAAIGVGASFFSDLAVLEHVTFTDNSNGSLAHADLWVHPDAESGTIEIHGSIVEGGCHDPDGLIASQGGNVEGPGNSCGFDPLTDQVGVPDMRLEPLAFGNPDLVTRSHQPRWNSPAVDDPLGNLAGGCPTPDQRLQARPKDGDGDGAAACDSGAVEARPPIFVDGFESGDTSSWSVTNP
jgi:hypothetical protein